jgi:phosphoribosylanthranilate isomerase
MWIKICANTNLDDAVLAVELGADALGFVFAPSSRRVTAQQVAAITPQLPASVEKIGVFDTLDFEEIASMVRIAGLTGAQLHSGFSGGVSARGIVALKTQLPQLRIIQTTHWKDEGQSADEFSQQLAEINQTAGIDAFLVDSRTANASGGTGVAFDWNASRKALSAPGHKRLIVAGGLNPGNVQQAIALLQPWGVDVASGVESCPGKKDAEKLAAFITNARQAPVLDLQASAVRFAGK